MLHKSRNIETVINVIFSVHFHNLPKLQNSITSHM